MTEVSALFVRKLIAQVCNKAPDPASLYAITGLSEEEAADPAAKVQIGDYYALVEAAAELEEPDIGFHLRTSASMQCEDFGAVGLAWKSAPSLRHSFSRMDRYARLYNPASSFHLEKSGGMLHWVHRPAPLVRKGQFLSNEAALGTFLALCRHAQQPDFTPHSVQFSHSPLDSAAAVRAHFGCPVIYEAPFDALIFTDESFDRPNAVGDESIWRFFTQHLRETYPEPAEGEEALERRVITQIADVLSEGVPSLTAIASRLGIGSRTLQRRLSDRGLTFQDLIDEARRRLAKQLLANTSYTLAEIAFLAGFSDQSAFTRAFKRCFGLTPKAYRQEALVGMPQGRDGAGAAVQAERIT